MASRSGKRREQEQFRDRSLPREKRTALDLRELERFKDQLKISAALEEAEREKARKEEEAAREVAFWEILNYRYSRGPIYITGITEAAPKPEPEAPEPVAPVRARRYELD